MKPKQLLNVVLLVVIAALAGVALLEPGKEEPKTVYLTDVNIDAVDRFELKNQETIAFEKQNGHWRLTAPFIAPANDIRVRQLLNIARTESRARYPLKAGEAPKFELDKPKAVLTIGQTRLVFGGSEPIDMLRYVQIDNTLHLVADDFFHHLIAKATDYVDKKLLPEDAGLKEIFMPGLNAKLGDKGQWILEPPGDATAMTELANNWQSARAIEVKRHEQPVQGEVVRIGLANGQSMEFVIIQREPDLLLVRPDWKLEYLVTAEAGKRLLSLQQPVTGKEEVEEDLQPHGGPDDATDYDPGDPGEDVEPDGK